MPMDLKKYPPNWKAISLRIRERDGQICRCSGQCGGDHPYGRCGAPNGVLIRRHAKNPVKWARAERVTPGWEWKYSKRVKVVLTVAHLCQDSRCAQEEHLLSLCQRCHLLYDLAQHKTNAAETRAKRKAEQTGQAVLLFPERPLGDHPGDSRARAGDRPFYFAFPSGESASSPS